jgi:hypothetical protein
MASLVHQASMPAMAPPCDEELVPQGFSCFGRSLSRASSSSRLDYRALQHEQGEERRAAAAQDARSARAKLRWKAVAHEIMAKGSGGARRRKKHQQLAAFSYDSRSYALNFDQGADE